MAVPATGSKTRVGKKWILYHWYVTR